MGFGVFLLKIYDNLLISMSISKIPVIPAILGIIRPSALLRQKTPLEYLVVECFPGTVV